MLKSHMDAAETSLVATSQIPANSGHSLHKGTPREAFVREFLEFHLPENVAIGTGEIIDANSRPKESRNQFDIVIYKKSYPKLNFGGGISGFLIESVIATIEVKSNLTKPDMEQAVKAAKAAKSLKPNLVTSFQSGYVPPKVLNYVVAYDGPAHIETAYNWIPPLHSALGISICNLPQGDARVRSASPSLDGIFVLKKGFIYFDNVPHGFATEKMRAEQSNLKWIFGDTASGNLLLLFLFIQTATANIEGRWLNPLPYLQSFKVPQLGMGIA